MNVIDYIKRYGDKTFEEKNFNEVDSLIFSLLSYVEYNGIVSKNFFNKRTIEEVGIDYFSINDKRKLKKKFVSNKMGIEILKNIYNKKRYKDLLMFNDVYISDEKQQFSAVSIELEPGLVFVSFEGTDYQISGWEEDGKMIYQFPVPAQRQAIKYLNKHFHFNDYKIIIGGHSKGGNLSLVSSMYANFLVRNRILEVYSFDGPGLLKNQLESNRYQKIKKKFKHIIPDTTIVGLLLMHEHDYKVIKSSKPAFISHLAFTWEVENDHFVDSELNGFSLMFEKSVSDWLEKYNENQKKEFIRYLFEVFRNANVLSLNEIFENEKIIIKLIREIKDAEDIVKEMFKDFIKILTNISKEYIKNKISSKFIKN